MVRLTLAILLIFQAADAKDYFTLKDVLSKEAGKGQTVLEKSFALPDALAKELNSKFSGGYSRGEKFTVHCITDTAGSVATFFLPMTEVLEEYGSYHKWALVFFADMSIRNMYLIQLTDEYSFALEDAAFLNQMKGKRAMSLKMGEGIDAVSGATMSCELALESLKKAEMILRAFQKQTGSANP
jgi:hypothetical protein